MGTPHNNAQIGEIAKNVIMPGDPNRAKLIAEKYLKDAKLVSDVRGILAFTGTYNGKEVTVMASGMGMPSMGIYCYELFKYYDVDNIVRIGSCGTSCPDLNLFDIILTNNVYTEGNFALTLASEDCHFVQPSEYLNNKIIQTAQKNDVALLVGPTICTEVFDAYMFDIPSYQKRIPKDINFLGVEMEAFALLYTAKVLNKNAACLMTVVDSLCKKQNATSEEREKGLDKMITLALESL